jgi:hypothetical protein
MEYADVIWDNRKQNLINKSENIQLDAARMVTGGTRLTSHDSLYEETKWEKLKDGRNNHKLVLFHKMNYNKTPQYLAELIPKTVGTRHTHNTRQISNSVNIYCRTSLYSEYFLPSTVKVWNDLPLPIRNLESLNSFKSLINTQHTKVPAHYYVGCRLGQILHARLRMNCSALDAHLFIRNLVESSNCICGITETVSHFLLDCPRHTTLRQHFFFSLLDIPETISLNLLIFGSLNLNDEENNAVFKSVQTFIIKSKRFTP